MSGHPRASGRLSLQNTSVGAARRREEPIDREREADQHRRAGEGRRRMEPDYYRILRDAPRKGPEGPGFRSPMVERDCHRKGRDCRHSRNAVAVRKQVVGHKHHEIHRLVVEAGHMEAVGHMRSAEKELVVDCTDPGAGSRLAGSLLGLGRTSRLHSSRQTPP